MASLQKGDEKAYARVYEQFVNQLFYFVVGIVKDRAAAEDICSETWVKAFRRVGDFATMAALRSFLVVTARNAAVDVLRATSQHANSHREIGYLTAGLEKDVEQLYITSEVLQHIYTAIESLPPQCREVVKLSLLEGRSIGEIAGQMNLAYKSVQNQKTKGMQLLRNSLLKSGLLPAFLLWIGAR